MKFVLVSVLVFCVVCANNVLTPSDSPYSLDSLRGSVQVSPVNLTGGSEPVQSPQFHRGYTDKQNQPCRPDWDKSIRYESEIISKAELVYIMSTLGIPGDRHDTMAAIIHAESGSQLSCFGDDYAPYYMVRSPNGDTWTYSYGLAQIRLLKGETGTGSCRDIQRLENNPTEQIACMWEISGQGKSFSPWTVTHKKRGYPYKKWLGKDW